MEVCEKYIEWLFDLCNIEKDKTPKEAPKLFYMGRLSGGCLA